MGVDDHEINLEVTNDGRGDFLVRVLDTGSEGAPRATMQLGVDDLLGRLPDLELSVLAAGILSRRHPGREEERLRAIGRQLFEALFSGPVLDVYRTRQEVARRHGGDLRIVLHLSVPKLALLPWEATWDPDDQQYVCLRQMLVRRVPGPGGTGPSPRSSSEAVAPCSVLSILGLISSPTDLRTLDAAGEKARLEEALAEQIASGAVELSWVTEASWKSVHDRMIHGRWHVLHFIGHGKYDVFRDEGSVALLGSDGRADWKPASRLAALVGDATPAIRLVVLNLCSSGQGGPDDLFSGTAATLVRGGVSAAIAMQFSFSDEAAIEFSRGFYQALSTGRGVDQALRSARIELHGESLEWVTPVLYADDSPTQIVSLPQGTRPLDVVRQPLPGPTPARANPTQDLRLDSLLGEVADDFAKGLAAEYRWDTGGSRLADYSRLTVCWEPADPSLTVGWGKLLGIAQGSRNRVPVAVDWWADSPGDLAGSSKQLPDLLKRVPTGWLVVLGERGSGKTGLMIGFVRETLARRQEGGPVPVLLSIRSWDPTVHDLNTWLEDQLTIDNPALSEPLTAGRSRPSRIAALLDEGLIVPILDGLDEMSPEHRRAVISRLNEAAAPMNPARLPQLLLTCRPEEFREAVGEHGRRRNLLTAAAAIKLLPLERETIIDALTDGDEDARWAPVVRDLDGRSPVSEALASPLAVTLAYAIYNEQVELGSDHGGAAPNPADLCDRERYPTKKSIMDHLLDAFIPARYASEGAPNVVTTQRQLTLLARYLQTRNTTLLRWWDLQAIAPRGFVPVVVGTICGIATAITALLGTHVGVGIGIGLGTGMMTALAIGLAFRSLTEFNDPDPSRGMAGALLGATLGAIGAGFAGKFGIGNTASTFSGVPVALAIGIGAGASTGFLGGLSGGLVGGFAGGLIEGVGLGLPAGLVNGFGVALAAGLAVKFLGRRKPALATPEWKREIGIPGGVVIGAATGLVAWREAGVVFGIIVAVAVGVGSGRAFGLRDADQDLTTVANPGAALVRDAIAFRRTALAAGLAAAAAGFLSGGMASAVEVGARGRLLSIVQYGLGIGLSSGVVIGLVFGFYCAASPTFRIVNWWLAVRHRVPWHLMNFLDDAHQKGVLRQSGADYLFRHEDLQEHLANSDPAPAGTSKPASPASRSSPLPRYPRPRRGSPATRPPGDVDVWRSEPGSSGREEKTVW